MKAHLLNLVPLETAINTISTSFPISKVEILTMIKTNFTSCSQFCPFLQHLRYTCRNYILGDSSLGGVSLQN